MKLKFFCHIKQNGTLHYDIFIRQEAAVFDEPVHHIGRGRQWRQQGQDGGGGVGRNADHNFNINGFHLLW